MKTERVKNHALEYYDDKEAMEIEDSLWWMVGRKFIIRNYLARAKKEGLDPTKTIMDIGCLK